MLGKPARVQRADNSADAKPPARKSHHKKKERKSRTVAKDPSEIKDLPLVKGALSWPVVKKLAKQLGRDDINQLRTDLSARKKLGQ